MEKQLGAETKSFQNSYWQNNPQSLCFRHKAALDYLVKYNLKTFLDIGAGDGFFIDYARSKNIQGKGIELSDTGIEMCNKKNIPTFQLDITGHNFELNEKFDAIACLDVLEHLFSPEQAIINIRKANSPYLIISVPNFNSITARLQMLLGKVPENNSPKKGHCFWFSQKVLQNLMENNNYEIIEWKYNTIKESFFFTRLLLSLFPSLFALSFVIISKKKD